MEEFSLTVTIKGKPAEKVAVLQAIVGRENTSEFMVSVLRWHEAIVAFQATGHEIVVHCPPECMIHQGATGVSLTSLIKDQGIANECNHHFSELLRGILVEENKVGGNDV
ncbi:MAG: hypothetical protein HYT37_04435 [Candidatus Sungbacteria bacterium]|nr:hypothetical protein [Candidatus Sungbacteria bacterium]